jgi:hypothetical protein
MGFHSSPESSFLCSNLQKCPSNYQSRQFQCFFIPKVRITFFFLFFFGMQMLYWFLYPGVLVICGTQLWCIDPKFGLTVAEIADSMVKSG